MGISEIVENVDKLDKKTKEELVNNIHELLWHKKRQDSKIISLQSEIRYLNKQLKKIKELIEKVLKTKTEEEDWKADK